MLYLSNTRIRVYVELGINNRFYLYQVILRALYK